MSDWEKFIKFSTAELGRNTGRKQSSHENLTNFSQSSGE